MKYKWYNRGNSKRCEGRKVYPPAMWNILVGGAYGKKQAKMVAA